MKESVNAIPMHSLCTLESKQRKYLTSVGADRVSLAAMFDGSNDGSTFAGVSLAPLHVNRVRAELVRMGSQGDMSHLLPLRGLNIYGIRERRNNT